MAQEGFAAKLRAKGQPAQAEVQPKLPIGLDAHDDLIEGRPQPTEDLLDVPLEKNPGHIVKIDLCLDEVTQSQLIALLQDNAVSSLGRLQTCLASIRR